MQNENEWDAAAMEEWLRQLDRKFAESLKRPGYDVIETVNEYGTRVFRLVRQKKAEP
jgi:phage terminase Nu1 subunit (DNA packaging protein)